MGLVVVSNRVAIADEKGTAAAGGLATALREALQAHGGTWFGWSGRVTAHARSPACDQPEGVVRYAVLDLSPLDHREYYNGFANRALWPTLHYRIGLSQFSRADHAGYLRVNRAFAQALAGLIEPDDVIWVHDYHLIPLAAELRRLGASNRIGYFHHIPWPARDVFGTLPASLELLRAMLAYDLVGLQTQDDAANLRHASSAISVRGPPAAARWKQRTARSSRAAACASRHSRSGSTPKGSSGSPNGRAPTRP